MNALTAAAAEVIVTNKSFWNSPLLSAVVAGTFLCLSTLIGLGLFRGQKLIREENSRDHGLVRSALLGLQSQVGEVQEDLKDHKEDHVQMVLDQAERDKKILAAAELANDRALEAAELVADTKLIAAALMEVKART